MSLFVKKFVSFFAFTLAMMVLFDGSLLGQDLMRTLKEAIEKSIEKQQGKTPSSKKKQETSNKKRKTKKKDIIATIDYSKLKLIEIKSNEFIVITTNSTVNPGMYDYFESAIDLATEKNAQGVIVELSTPGGLLTTTRDIVSLFLKSKVPIIVYVSPPGTHAASAGVMITSAGHLAFMAPATNMGSAHPVGGQGKDIGEALEKKVMNDVLAFVENIARVRGRNVTWIKEAVSESVSIIAEEAVKKKVIDGMATDIHDLIKKLDGQIVKLNEYEKIVLHTKEASLTRLEMNLKQKVLAMLGNPNIAYMLMALGGLGIYLEISNPGLIVPGVVGGISLIIALISFQALPVNYGAFLLILLGLILLVAEMFVPSFGALGIGGIVAFIFGSLFLIDTKYPGLQIDRSLIFTIAGLLLFVVLALGYFILKSRKTKVPSGDVNLIGKVGEVVIDILKGHVGKVMVQGETWDAVADEELQSGTTIKVIGRVRMKLKVAKHDEVMDEIKHFNS